MEWGYEANHPFDERCAGQETTLAECRAHSALDKRSPFLAFPLFYFPFYADAATWPMQASAFTFAPARAAGTAL